MIIPVLAPAISGSATAVAGVSYATFDGTATDVTLSNGNLTAQHANTNSNAGVRSTSLKSAGKHYFEIAITDVGGNSDCVGIVTAAGTFANMGALTPTNCAIVKRFLNPNSGVIYSNGASSGKNLGVGFTDGAIIGIAVDFDNDAIWFRIAPSGNWNGDALADPATNAGGVSMSSFSATTMAPAVGFGGTGTSSAHNMTANFGASAFTGSVPSGFTSGWQA